MYVDSDVSTINIVPKKEEKKAMQEPVHRSSTFVAPQQAIVAEKAARCALPVAQLAPVQSRDGVG